MRATIDSDIIQEALRICLRLAAPISGNVTFKTDGPKLYMLSSSELSRCTVLMPCEVTGTALFAISTESLKSATKGRKELEMVYSKTMLNIKSGRYHSSLTTVDAIQVDEDASPEEGKIWKLSADQAMWLKSAVATVALKPPQNLSTYMPISVRLTDKSAFVACYDENHMAFVNDREITGSLDLTLPIETLNSVLDVFNKLNFSMNVTKSSLVVKNKLVNVILALPETEDEELGASAVLGKAKESLKADGLQIELNRNDVLAFLDNARAVATKERAELKIVTDAGKVSMEVSTVNGTSKITIKGGVKKHSVFNVDFEYFDEAVRKCGDSVIFKVVMDAFISFKTKSAHILVALNQEG